MQVAHAQKNSIMCVEPNLNHWGKIGHKCNVQSDILGGQIQQGPSVQWPFSQRWNTHTRFNLYSNIKPHTEARRLRYLPISISKQLLSRGEPDCLCMTTSVWERWESAAVKTKKKTDSLTDGSKRIWKTFQNTEKQQSKVQTHNKETEKWLLFLINLTLNDC